MPSIRPTDVSSAFRSSVRSRAAARPRRIVLPEAEDPRTLAAARTLIDAGLVTPLLAGDPARIEPLLAAHGLEGRVEIVDTRTPPDAWVERLVERRAHRGMTPEKAREYASDPLIAGALMVGLGEVDGSTAGAVHTTGDVIRAALWCVGPAEGVRTVSSSFYMRVPDFRGRGAETLTYTDAAVVQYPTAEQLCDIASAAATARSAVVGDDPVVAFLSHSTKGSAAGASIDVVREAMALFLERRPEVPADGEFQADAALIESVGRRKAPGSEIAGRANVLVFPDLDAANIAYKLTERLTGGEAVGPIVQGLARPCNDLSRGSDADDIVDTVCVTSLQAK